MRVPEVLWSLTDQGVIDEVVRPLKSGKEAQVYLVRAGGDVRVAKVYKDASERSFKQRAQYSEGRRVRNTRDQRAIDRRSRHGRAQEEQAWKSAEVDVIHRLHAQGVRVPAPWNFIDGVLIMELVRGDDGYPAPRLAELDLDAQTATAYFERLLREVVKMLCAGIVHGDLSDYNILVDADGPVVIDFPQSVDAAQNRNAKKLLIRDVDNLSAFLSRFSPSARRRPYGEELWAAYESNTLTPDLELTGRFQRSSAPVDMRGILSQIEDADEDERRRREKVGGQPQRKREVVMTAPQPEGGRGRRRSGGAGGAPNERAARSGDPRRRDARAGDGRSRSDGDARARGGDTRDGDPRSRNGDGRGRDARNGDARSRHGDGRNGEARSRSGDGRNSEARSRSGDARRDDARSRDGRSRDGDARRDDARGRDGDARRDVRSRDGGSRDGDARHGDVRGRDGEGRRGDARSRDGGSRDGDARHGDARGRDGDARSRSAEGRGHDSQRPEEGAPPKRRRRRRRSGDPKPDEGRQPQSQQPPQQNGAREAPRSGAEDGAPKRRRRRRRRRKSPAPLSGG
ncbi:MAG: PA4780 family RIO1-like protein kinase [Planctomycetota bacterium]